MFAKDEAVILKEIMSFFLYLFLSETLALLFVLLAVSGLISNVSNLCRRRPEDYDIHNSRKKPRIDYAPEFHQRPG